MLGLPPVTDWGTLLTERKLVPAGHTVGTPELLFEKLDDSFAEAQLAKLHAAAPAPPAPAPTRELEPLKAEIQFDDWAKIDLRAARVTHCEPVPKADKLLKLSLDLGPLGTRTVLSGIAEHYKPEDVAGRMVTLVANLAPRKMRGIESQGMILMAEDAQGRLVFTSPAPDAQPGSPVR
jgi:methionyl-tRNA synthetase